MTPDMMVQLVTVLVPLILSLTVHEYAHAAMAKALGDDTAERQGRFTLDPMSHIDPIGSLALPALLVLMNTGFWFGWAKPVPYDPLRFSSKIRMKHGVLLVAAAGPLSNLLLAVLSAALLSAFPENEAARAFLGTCVLLNVLLFLFNLLPIPPLDGSKVAYGLIPDRWNGVLSFFRSKPYIAPMAFMMVFLVGGRLIGPPMMAITEFLISLFGA
ncbi:MAG: site-2 protease family protein [Myxococcota bacterium]